MNRTPRSLINFLLSVVTCLLVVGLSTAPGFSHNAPQSVPEPSAHATISTQSEAMMAGGMSGQAMKRYAVNLSRSHVVPNAPSTSAMGMAEATLQGDRLMVRGNFRGLSSALRDYATDPITPPNPKITSAVHIHRGESTENGPFQFALTVMMNDMGRGGRFSGEYQLSTEQLQALMDGQLYIDLHTTQNRAGELRGSFRPA